MSGKPVWQGYLVRGEKIKEPWKAFFVRPGLSGRIPDEVAYAQGSEFLPLVPGGQASGGPSAFIDPDAAADAVEVWARDGTSKAAGRFNAFELRPADDERSAAPGEVEGPPGPDGIRRTKTGWRKPRAPEAAE